MTAAQSSETGPQASGFLTQISRSPGVQLWSVKNDLFRNFDATLETLADAGVRYVEAAGYDLESRTLLGLKPEVFQQKIEAAGMQCIGAHAAVSPDTIGQILDDLSPVNITSLITSMYPDENRTANDYYRIAERYNHIGSITKNAGIHFGYHNHHFEFTAVQGERPIDILLKNTDPGQVVFEADLGWVVQAGETPEALFNRYPGRFPLWHLRDVTAGGAPANAGDGIVDFHSLQPLKKQAGFLYGIVETPSAATDGLNRVIASFNYIMREQLY